MNQNEITAWLLVGVVNEHLLKPCRDPETKCGGCCPECCGPCGALEAIRDHEFGHVMAGLVLEHTGEWTWLKDGLIDWPQIEAHWKPECLACSQRGAEEILADLAESEQDIAAGNLVPAEDLRETMLRRTAAEMGVPGVIE